MISIAVMSRYIYLPGLALLFATSAIAQSTATKPCSAPECRQMDFWVGDWNLTHSDTVHAENHITKEMDGCLIHEHFHSPSTGYTGESWSMYNVQRKLWQQTWVDNQGAYIALTGTLKDGKLTLHTESAQQPGGKTKQNRMVYHNITNTSLDWDWEETTDAGKTWINKWHIHYSRKP